MPAESTLRLLREVPVPLRDGTIARAEVWLPDDDEPRPAILFRTPYRKEGAAPPLADARAAIDRGYGVVCQDVRGCGSSEGVFEPYTHEEADGFDTIAWVAAQPWCDGRVVMGGASYVGVTQWLAAASGAPALRAIAPVISSDDVGEGWSFTSGVLEETFLSTWSVHVLCAAAEPHWQDDPTRAWEDRAAVAQTAPWTADWYAAPSDADYWAQRSAAGRRDEIAIPALVVGGWYDSFLHGTLASFARSRDSRDRLVVGPWVHESSLLSHIGDFDAGPEGSGAELFAWMLDFYDAVLAGADPPGSRVRAYVFGARRWLELEAWPPAEAAALTLPLEGGSFAVDPQDPVPGIGGRAARAGTPDEGNGIRDHRPVAARSDVHAARVRVASQTLLAGPVRVSLAGAAAGAGECLWTVTLCLEQPDGALHNLCEGVARADAAADTVEIGLGDVCVALPAGSALVALVAGSSFPRWPRPPTARTQSFGAGSTLSLTTAPPALLA